MVNSNDNLEDMGGFVSYESERTQGKDLNYCDVMSGFPPEKLPGRCTAMLFIPTHFPVL